MLISFRSFSLSSTRRMVCWSFMKMKGRLDGLVCLPQVEPETATVVGRGLDADASAHAFDSFLNNGQANACAFVGVAVEPEEKTKNLLLMFGGDTDAVIFHPDTNEARQGWWGRRWVG